MALEIEVMQQLFRQAAAILAQIRQDWPADGTPPPDALAGLLALVLRACDLVLITFGYRRPAGLAEALGLLAREGVITLATAEDLTWLVSEIESSGEATGVLADGSPTLSVRLESAVACLRQEINRYLIDADFPV